MKLPFLNNKKTDKEYYLGLILDDEKATAVIIEEALGKIKNISRHSEHLPSMLEVIPEDDLIKIVDRTISKAEEVLPPNIETHKTIFGVKENWVEQESKKIKKDYLAKLKKVCDALDLSPIGFMVIGEAIANMMQHDEGSPLSAILVDVSKNNAYITLFRGGQISESASGAIEHSIPATVDNLLKRFTAPVLPTKIILLHTLEAKALSQHFINHEWSKSLPFLHVPQISVLPIDYEARAITYGASQQMGFEVIDVSEKIHDIEDSSQDEKDTEEKENEEQPPIHNKTDEAGFGFMLDQDVSKQTRPEVLPEILPKTELKKADAVETFDKSVEHENLEDESLKKDLDAEDYTEEKKDSKIQQKIMTTYSGIIGILQNISFPKITKSLGIFSKNKGLKLPVIIIGAFLILVAIISLFYFYKVKATIVLSVKPNVVTQNANVTFSSNAGNDFSKNIIAAKSVSTSIDGEVSTDATGKKDTGNKAKGSVTIYNNSDSSVSLSSGTSLKSSNNLTFTTDKDINIASASGDIFSGTKPGTVDVSVTAKDIGTESNLPSGSKFTVGSNTNLAAKNDSAFSGGNKKAITVVSSSDLAKLKTDLSKSLEKNATDELSKKIGSEEKLLPGFSDTTLSKTKFDKGVDDEAKQVKLNATVNFNAISYQNSDLENFDKSILKDHFTQDISFADNSLKNEVTDVKAGDNNEEKATLKITAGLLPKIDNNEVVNKLKNKSSKEAKEILNTLPQVAGSEIKFSPNILFLSSIFPRLP
ncbi:MAG TPA: baseplate J/gp47 family protein, partial [Candidatus Saccharimonadales bacterium]|nr:baseplate J/gp47 family protein [Candidatus Saccharimonadales bacterium]